MVYPFLKIIAKLRLWFSREPRDLIKLVEKDGWLVVRQKGSHRVFKHPLKPGHVTIPIHRMSDEIRPGTFNSILKQAGLK